MEPCGAHLGSPLIWHMSKSRFLKKSTPWEGRKYDLGGSHPFVLALQLEAETETLHSASSDLLRRHVGAAVSMAAGPWSSGRRALPPQRPSVGDVLPPGGEVGVLILPLSRCPGVELLASLPREPH